MDPEAQPTPTHENGAKIVESASDPPGEVNKGKEDGSKNLRITRQTRSQTPQKQKEKNDDNQKLKKTELKVVIQTAKNADQGINGHNETNSDNSEIKGKKGEQEKVKKPESSKNAKTSETKGKKEEVEHKNSAESEKSKSEGSPKKPSKKDILKDDLKKSSTIETIESESASKNKNPLKSEGEGVEMDPLILATDEPDPELQFDENSDLESGKGSPIQLRCKTRRSHTRNIPTPKTPKSTDSESEKNSVIAPTPTPENLNDTNDSLNVGDISTRAQLGSGGSRLAYIADDLTLPSEDNSYLNYSRDKSLRETLRSLSPRKTFRPINDAYRQRAFRNNQNKSDLNLSYSEGDSVNRITGVKRKRSSTPEDSKKFKADSVGFVSYLSSPLANFKNRFITDGNSSTPTLTGYKDSRKDIHEDISYTEVVSEAPEKKNWCAIM